VEQADGCDKNGYSGAGEVSEAGEHRSPQQVLAAIERGIADVRAGRVIDDEDFQREIDEEFGPLA
jgi:predicted transcriptional regulator